MGRSRTRQPESLAGWFDATRADYQGARNTRWRRRRSGVPVSGSGADYHYRHEVDYLRMLELARDMDRNDVAVGPLVDRAVCNTIQDGFRLQPTTGDATLDQDLRDWFNEWASDPEACDVAGELDFQQQAKAALRNNFVDGDSVFLATADGPLQLIEGHRVRTPRNTTKNVVSGVLLDDVRRRREYWVTRDEIDPSRAITRVGDVVKYPVRDGQTRIVFHPRNTKRYTQTRGVTAFAPIFDTLGQFEDLAFAKLVQAQIVSCFTILRERDGDFAGDEGAPLGLQETETISGGSGGNTKLTERLGPGMLVGGQPGEKFTGFSPGVPNAEFFPHARLVLTLLGINLGVPLVLYLMDASETNFSGWRGALEQARLGFRQNQRDLVAQFHSPVYRWKVQQLAEEDGAIRRRLEAADVTPLKHVWHPPKWTYIEPVKDITARLLEQKNVFTSPRRGAAKHGDDFDEILEETVQDNAAVIRRAKREADAINSEFSDGQPVHWRELVSLPTPDGVNVSLTVGDNEKSGPASGPTQAEE